MNRATKVEKKETITIYEELEMGFSLLLCLFYLDNIVFLARAAAMNRSKTSVPNR